MAAGSEEMFIGWYLRDGVVALVNFWDGGPIGVPVDALVASVQDDAYSE